jgi:hypothetical protein
MLWFITMTKLNLDYGNFFGTQKALLQVELINGVNRNTEFLHWLSPAE